MNVTADIQSIFGKNFCRVEIVKKDCVQNLIGLHKYRKKSNKCPRSNKRPPHNLDLKNGLF